MKSNANFMENNFDRAPLSKLSLTPPPVKVIFDIPPVKVIFDTPLLSKLISMEMHGENVKNDAVFIVGEVFPPFTA